MAVDRKLTAPSLLLVLVALCGGLSLVFLLFNLQRELDEQSTIFREDNTWEARQIEREARVFRHTLLLYSAGTGGISADQLSRRFDVLWSRIENMDKGEVGKLYMQLEGAQLSLTTGRKMLRVIDQLLRDLQPGDALGRDEILAELDPFVANAFAVTRNATAKTLQYQEKRRISLKQTGKLTLFLAVCILCSGIILFALLLKNQHHLDQLTLNLEEKVNERTVALQESNQNLKMMSQAIEQSPVSVIICDVEGKIKYVNPKFEEITGYGFEEAYGRNPRFLKSGKTSAETYQKMWQTVHADQIWQGEICNKRKSGELFWEYVSLSPIKNNKNAIAGYIAVKEDISQRKRYEEQLVKQANYDSLTELPNRSLAMDRLKQAILQVQRRGGSVALLFIDLDNFKQVNDTLGHDCGDLVLKQAAIRFKDCLRDCDTAARFGGDEFLIILSELQGKSDVIPIIDRILYAFATPFCLGENQFIATTSIGVSMCPQNGSDPAQLLKCSDRAMYEAKNRGKNNYNFFEPEVLV